MSNRTDRRDSRVSTWLQGLGTSHEMRSIAARLQGLADGIDGSERGLGSEPRPRRQDGTVTNGALAEIALRQYRARRRRNAHLDCGLFGEPAWDMLLDLFIRRVQGERISTTSLCLAGDVPVTTGLRWINVLEAKGLVVRSADPRDQRLSIVELSDLGLAVMRSCLSDWADS